MSTLERLAKLKERAEELERKATRAEGAMERIAAEILKMTGCATIQDAEAHLVMLQAEAARKERNLVDKLEKFEKAFDDFAE